MVLLYGWLLLALATLEIRAERCLFTPAELSKIKNNDIVSIDSKKIVRFIDHNPNELAVLNFIANNRNRLRINDKYKFFFERILNNNGIEQMNCDNRLVQLVHEVDSPHHAIANPRTKVQLFEVTGRLMLIHGLYSTVVTCSHQIVSVNCGLSAGGLTTSLVLAKLEPIAIAKFAPKIVKMTSRVGTVIGEFLPKAQFAIRLVGTEAAFKMLKVGGAAVGGAFDIIDIAMNAKILDDCQKKGGCDEVQIRDSIVSISISGISFVSGIAFAALDIPGIGVPVAAALMLGQMYYRAFSNMFDYKKKYHTTAGESADVFFSTLAFTKPLEPIQMLARQTEYISSCAKIMTETLNNYTGTIKGYGIGLGKISLDNNDIKSAWSAIDMSWETKVGFDLSRVIPTSVDDNVEMICLPAFKMLAFENDIIAHHKDAVYFCDNAMVFTHKGRPNADTIVYNLQHVNDGEVKGSHKWNNVFQIFNSNGELKVLGGHSVTNTFMFLDDTTSLDRPIKGGVNAKNVFDMTNLNTTDDIQFVYENNELSMQLIPNSGPPWPSLLVDNFDPRTDKRIYQYVGPAHAQNSVKCEKSVAPISFLSINTGGGVQSSHDQVTNCPQVVLFPFTTFFKGIDQDSVIIDVQTKGYSGVDLESRINFGDGQVQMLFNEFDLTSSDTTMFYSPGQFILSILLQWQQNSYRISIQGFGLSGMTLVLFNKKHHMIVPRIPPRGEGFEKIRVSYDVFAVCPETSYANLIADIDDDCISEMISYYNDNAKELITVQFNDSQRHDSLVIGSSHSDIIQFNNNIKFAKGRNGNDVYYVNGDHEDAIIILNHAVDKLLDFVVTSREVPRVLSQRNNSLVVGNVEIRDFFISREYQHVAFVDKKGKQYFPLTMAAEMIPFIMATVQQNAFFLDATFNYSYIVLHGGSGDATYEMYRDNDDLQIIQQRSDNVSCAISIEKFYIDSAVWSNVTWVMYYDNGTVSYRPDFIFNRIKDVIDYKTKLKQDYDNIFVDYFFKPTTFESILYDSDRIGVLHIDRTISARNIDVNRRNDRLTGQKNLVLIENQYGYEFEIRNWDTASNRISIIELPLTAEHFERITIRDVNRFGSDKRYEIESLIGIAGDNYEILAKITPLTMAGVRCIISNASLSDGDVNSYKCLDFQSLDEQVNFVNKYCDKSTYEWFKSNTTTQQARDTITYLRNNLVLQNTFAKEESNKCEPYFKNFMDSNSKGLLSSLLSLVLDIPKVLRI